MYHGLHLKAIKTIKIALKHFPEGLTNLKLIHIKHYIFPGGASHQNESNSTNLASIGVRMLSNEQK